MLFSYQIFKVCKIVVKSLLIEGKSKFSNCFPQRVIASTYVFIWSWSYMNSNENAGFKFWLAEILIPRCDPFIKLPTLYRGHMCRSQNIEGRLFSPIQQWCSFILHYSCGSGVVEHFSYLPQANLVIVWKSSKDADIRQG